ncbi:50S ribosomal protein L11 methyltransferase [Sulfurimonas sp. SAG-AH-194-I05]|nr:50S ribosomal protein L11 methyltransferase [Sulfurimonas sp. SAG-AH-194-I05]MDF1874390.1 50S ribosomal protein L11 methyltransferase [Sulfurimonas sp. SAG-AH-194-I05]
MQEYYYELVVKVSSHLPLFSDFLSDTVPVGFEERDDGFIIRSEESLDTIEWGLEQFCEALNKALNENIELETTQKKQKNNDWIAEYKNSIQPLFIDKFYIHPTWNEPSNSHINIAIDPALAFGTGHHPTTASSLKAISKYVTKEDEVLDVGCGSGILGIGAMKLGALVDACDTDIISVDNSVVNAELNNVKFHHIWEGSCSIVKKHYDVVVANIVADVLTFIAKDLKRALKKDGVLILSGILDKYEDKVLNFYKDCEVLQRIHEEEWITLILKLK